MSTLLIVDDEESICWGLSKVISRMGHTPITKSSAEAALRVAKDEELAAIVLDVRLPGISGLDAMSQLRDRFGPIPIIVMTAHGDLQTAVDTVRNGAFEYVVKPFETSEIRELIKRALEASEISNVDSQATDADSLATIDGMLGKSRLMQDVFARIALAANSDAGVLILGESGTGKELAARAVHRYSKRADGPFVPVNIAALSSSLAESELFGHVRGAFTGAESDRDGLLKQANGGTLFMDEVGEIPLEMQVKLLRALEHGAFTPVGSAQAIESDFRVVSATNADLASAIRAGDFRHDLYYRLAAFHIEMPPLRKRGDDIVLLAQQFAGTLGGHAQSISPDARQEILSRAWHGNVRELRNAIEHALVLARGGPVESRHLPEPLLVPAAGPDERGADQQLSLMIQRWVEARLQAGEDASAIHSAINGMVETPLIRGTLARHGGNYSAAAKDLGVHRTTLRKKVNEQTDPDSQQ